MQENQEIDSADDVIAKMLKEQHLRKVESALTEAIAAAKVAGMSEQELVDTLQTLLAMEEI